MQWQLKPHACPTATVTGFAPDPAAVKHDDLLAQVETDPDPAGSLVGVRHEVLDAKELLEHTSTVFIRNARAVVGDGNSGTPG